ANNTQTYAFPIGNGLTNSDYYLAELKNNNLNGVNYIDAYFGTLTNHNDADMVATEAGMTYNSLSTEGVWYLTPDSSITSGTYDLRCYINNFTGLSDNRFAILSRQDSSLTGADWSCDPAGIGNPGINPSNGDGRLVSDGYALRRGFNHFSQFGIGKIACQLPQLPDDTTICAGDSIVLYPGNFSSYLWSTGATDSTITVFAAGQYIVEVTNNNTGCGTMSDTVNVNVAIIDVTTQTQNITCHSFHNGQITVSPTGGTPEYHYQWSPAVSDSATATNLYEGNYYITITDANGCKAYVEKIPVIEPDSLYLLASNTTNPLCNGSNDGEITILYAGGTPPYSYQWNTTDTTSTLSQLTAGSYSVTLTDHNGCNDIETFNLTEPDAITITGNTDIDEDYHGYINLSVENGTLPYSFVWSNGETTQNIDKLSSGEYSVTVTDFNGCSVVDTFTITIPLIIPNIITPNNDGYNDTWNIVNIESYDNINIEIYNRWGNIIYTYSGSGIGYADKTVQWDGKWNGKKLPFASYIYIVELEDNNETYNGVVTIER
ncbi:MAG: gliding motility-associated C-terminal domain-containing protein, partial [Bacteroidales bacterium]|nr:gliding motility-associated C-terminal domain-containing protein [Bacteroidales bacterium]